MAGAETGTSRAAGLLLAFEEECDPFRHCVRGYSLWTALRFQIWEGLKIALGELSPRGGGAVLSGPGLAHRLSSGMAEWNTYRALVRGARRWDIIALTSTNRLRDQQGDVWRNACYDYVDEPLPSTLYFYIDSMGARKPLSPSSVFVSARAQWLRMMQMKRTSFEGREAVASLHAEFARFLSGAVPGLAPPVSLAGLEYEAVRFAVQYDAFIKIFAGTRPAVVISDCYYDRTWAVAAARSMGIPVLELQHGIVYDGHVAYQFAPAAVASHRETLPVPDRVLSFGPYFSGVFRDGGPWADEAVVDVGFARMAFHQRQFTWVPPSPGENLRLLVSSQWILTSRLSAFLTKLCRMLPPGIDVVVKPHPLDSTGAYEGIDGVRVGDVREDFYEALDRCHLHASVFSTTLVESVGLGVPTMVIGLPGAENARALVENGACRRVDSAAALAEQLKALQAEPEALSAWHARTLDAAEYFWAPSPGPTMRHLLEQAVTRSRSGE